MKESKADISAVVALIYENVFAPKSWSGLVDGNAAKGDGPEADDKATGSLDPAYLERTLPYLEHALEIADKRQGIEKSQASQAALFQDIPLPVCVVSKDLSLLSANNSASDALQEGTFLSLSTGKVRAGDTRIQRDLANAIASAIKAGQSQTLNCTAESGAARSILIVPTLWNGQDTDDATVALFLSFETGDIKELAMVLADAHGLTGSEAEVAAYLAQGFSLDQIAEEKNTSINTVRTQIKTVFAKTGATRQGELISLLLNGPAMWIRLLRSGNNGVAKPTSTGRASEAIMQLADGRNLSYGDYGPVDGKPMFLFHHLLGSKTERPDDESLLTRLGIRLIVPERPGVGLSSRCKERPLADWADDVRQLADHLDYPHFYVVGFSAGGPFAAACAALLGDRVITAGLVASLMPSDELPQDMRIGLLQRFTTGMARHFPSAIQALLEFRYGKLLESPDEIMNHFSPDENSADAALFKDPVIARHRMNYLREASHLSKEVFASELVALSRPWGFRMSDIKVPVKLWHGRQDDFVPFEHAEAICGNIPRCDSVLRDDWGHFFLYREWESVLRDVAG